MCESIRAEIRVLWDAYYRHHYWVLSGTKSLLDGTVLAVPTDKRPMARQAKDALAEVNARRHLLGLTSIRVQGLN